MNPLNALFKTVYWPLCRTYARHLGDRPADGLMRLLCIPQFLRVHRFWPNFIQPHRFSEKVWSRQLHDRDPRLTVISDKLRVRDCIADKVGEDCLIPLLWSGEDPADIPFDILPSKFVIKGSHGCGYVIIVEDMSRLDRTKVTREVGAWLRENFGEDYYLGIAWGYKNVKPTIIIESFIEENGKPPVDYKFYCFSGRVEFVTLHYDRFEEHRTRTFDRDFEPHEFRYDFEQWTGELARPTNFEEMVEFVEALAREFDFIRVDVYSVDGKIYFSELTPYPGGVSTKYLPARQDRILGEKWKHRNGIMGISG